MLQSHAHALRRQQATSHTSLVSSQPSQLLTITNTPLFISCICLSSVSPSALWPTSLISLVLRIPTLLLLSARANTCPGDGYICALISAAAFSRKKGQGVLQANTKRARATCVYFGICSDSLRFLGVGLPRSDSAKRWCVNSTGASSFSCSLVAMTYE